MTERSRLAEDVSVKNLRVEKSKITFDWSGRVAAKSGAKIGEQSSGAGRRDFTTRLTVRMVPEIAE